MSPPSGVGLHDQAVQAAHPTRRSLTGVVVGSGVESIGLQGLDLTKVDGRQLRGNPLAVAGGDPGRETLRLSRVGASDHCYQRTCPIRGHPVAPRLSIRTPVTVGASRR